MENRLKELRELDQLFSEKFEKINNTIKEIESEFRKYLNGFEFSYDTGHGILSWKFCHKAKKNRLFWLEYDLVNGDTEKPLIECNKDIRKKVYQYLDKFLESRNEYLKNEIAKLD